MAILTCAGSRLGRASCARCCGPTRSPSRDAALASAVLALPLVIILRTHSSCLFGFACSPQPGSEDSRAATRPRMMLKQNCICCGASCLLHPAETVAVLCVGPDVTKRFLSDNNLDLIVRSHEVHTIL